MGPHSQVCYSGKFSPSLACLQSSTRTAAVSVIKADRNQRGNNFLISKSGFDWPAEEARMALRGFSKFEQMFRAKLASDAPLQVLNTMRAIPRNTNFVSDAPLQVLNTMRAIPRNTAQYHAIPIWSQTRLFRFSRQGRRRRD